MTENFLVRFLVMLIAVALTSTLGAAIGVGSGAIVIRSRNFAETALIILRLGLWIPFLASWVFWSSWIPALAAAILASCYYYLSVKSAARVRLSHVLRATVLQALFIFLVSQVWLGREYGWDWFMEESLGYSLLILVLLLFLVDQLFPFDFDQTAENRGTLLMGQVLSGESRSWVGLFLAGACLISSLFFTASIWKDISISLLEIIGGLIFSGSVAFVVVRLAASRVIFRRWLFAVLPLTYITPVILPLFLLHRSVLTLWWQTTAVAATLSFFPFVQALWGLRNQPTKVQLLLAADDALPFAFVGMLFGETMNAVAGLGFLLSTARRFSESLIAAVAALGLLIALSAGFRWGNKT